MECNEKYDAVLRNWSLVTQLFWFYKLARDPRSQENGPINPNSWIEDPIAKYLKVKDPKCKNSFNKREREPSSDWGCRHFLSFQCVSSCFFVLLRKQMASQLYYSLQKCRLTKLALVLYKSFASWDGYNRYKKKG